MSKESLWQFITAILGVILTFILSTGYSNFQRMDEQLTAITQTTSIQGLKNQRDFIAELFREQKTMESEIAVLRARLDFLEDEIKELN